MSSTFTRPLARSAPLADPLSAQRPRIAIVVVTRNCLGPLEVTIRSIEALADPRVDPILIDGASVDGTAECVLGLQGWARFVTSEPDAGIYDAMNKGWAAASTASYVLYLGAGDTVLALPADRELVAEDGTPSLVVFGDCRIGEVPFRSRWGLEMRLRNTVHHQALLVHRSVSASGPFDPTLRVYGDWDFNLRMLNCGLAARYVPGFRTRAEPGGVSWRHDLGEIRRVAGRHSGPVVGAASGALNALYRWRRDRAIRGAG